MRFEIPDCHLRRVQVDIVCGEEGATARGVLTVVGELTPDLAETLECKGAYDERLDSFVLAPDRICEPDGRDMLVSLGLLAMNGRDAVFIPTCNLKALKASQGYTRVELAVSVGFGAGIGEVVSEFAWRNPGWFGTVVIRPKQARLDFAAEEPEDDDDAEEAE